jgi:hypothetical protein
VTRLLVEALAHSGFFAEIAMLLFLISALAQVPAPDAADRASQSLHAEYRAIQDREAGALRAVADRLVREKRTKDATSILGLLATAEAGGATRFRPLGEFIPGPAKGQGMASQPASRPMGGEVDAIRRAASQELFSLAEKAAAPGVQRFALADRSLRGVIERDPDHAEARRLLGFVRSKGGWATPHAVDLLNRGFVLHPRFGWVLADWVPRLDAGELPGEFSSSGKPRTWLPADQADALRSDFAHGWQIKTAPHFEIQTNVPLSDAIAFGRRLEGMYELFTSEFADVIGPEFLPLARRFRDRDQKPTASPKKFGVSYFASKAEYVQTLKAKFGLDESISLGYYMPPWEAKRFPKALPRSYFYRDDANPIAAFETLYHEGSHQVLFETAGKAAFDRNRGNYWVWEGLGTYFETVRPQPDGTLLVGAPVGARMAAARQSLIGEGRYVPIAEFVAMDSHAFGEEADQAVYRNYAQAMALAVFLLNGQDGRYREPFLEYVSDGYRGRLKAGSLADALGVEFPTLDEQFVAFLKSAVPATTR